MVGMWLKDIWDTLRTISIGDVFDITIIACLLYFVLLWFKQTKAAFVARGIFIFAMVYVVAQQAGMYLTIWMFQGFFAIFVIALVVIFQEELRSFFERLAELPPGAWAGPVKSAYGVHLVHIFETVAARTPPLEEVREAVLGDWRAAKALELREQDYARRRTRFVVEIRREGVEPPTGG